MKELREEAQEDGELKRMMENNQQPPPPPPSLLHCFTSEGNVCKKFVVHHQPRVNLQSFRLTVPSALCTNGATLSRPRRLHIAGLNQEKDFGEIMNSTDSLSTGGNAQEGAQQETPRKVDTFMQGSENQESPGGGSAHSSISPPVSLSMLHDITAANAIAVATTTSTATATNQQTATAVPAVTLPQLCTPTPTPIGSHQILVDPTTGQHFLVSSAPAPAPPPPPHAQIIYQPVYYSATPAQPVYYHAFASGAPGAYVVAATPISSAQSTGAQITPPHMVLGQRFSSTPPPAAPPSVAQSTVGGFARSVADFDDTRSVMTADERHTVFEHPLVSSATRSIGHAVDIKQILVSKNSVSPPQTSPVFAKTCSIFDSSAAVSTQRASVQMRPAEGSPTYQQAINKSAIPSDVTAACMQPEEGERTPLFGAAPSWWGENGTSFNQQVQSDTESTRLHNSASTASDIAIAAAVAAAQPCVLSDTEVMKMNRRDGGAAAGTENGASRRPLKSIRMDIDLNEPFVDEEAKKEEKTKAAPRTASSTAFTVSFDSEEGSPKSNLSLQDAARKTSSRRFMRRSAPAAGMVSRGAAAKIAGLTAASSDPKQYLLNKMLMGVAEESNEGPEIMGSCEGGEGKPDVDTLSEAETYVVDDPDRLNQVVASQVVKDSDAESVSSESTTTQSSDILRPPSVSVRSKGPGLPQINENTSSTEGGSGKGGDHLLRELLRIGQRRGITGRALGGVAPSTPPLSNSARITAAAAAGTRVRVTRRPESSGTDERHYASHRLCTLASSSSSSAPRTAVATSMHHRMQTVAGASGSSDGVTFRRGDGGRYSMRFSGGAKGHPSTAGGAAGRNDRPPFRIGGGNTRAQASGTGTAKESAEMTAWLRRKDYNPMKAAAEAKKLQQLKARADKFVSNRSISFHQGARPFNTGFSPVVQDLSKARHNRSQDDLSVDGAVCGPETILASYSKGITRDLNKLRSAEAATQDEAHVNGLENAVQQLTMKCNRSIELIRNSHLGHLSESVENLLEMAIEPVKDCTGSVTDQLDRLSAAFDAIQKYLEVSSASLPPSPSGSSPTASVTALSTSPSRRPCSAYQSKLAAAKRSPSGGRKNS